MEPGALFSTMLARSERDLKRALEGLTPDDLRQQPAGTGSNPIGWLMWHLTWAQDLIVSRVQDKELLWTAGGWHAKFGMEPTPQRFTPEDVHTFDPKDVDTLVAYYDAVRARTEAYATTVTREELDREVPGQSGQPPVTVASRLAQVISDNVQHIGQIAYLRGCVKGQGWY